MRTGWIAAVVVAAVAAATILAAGRFERAPQAQHVAPNPKPPASLAPAPDAVAVVESDPASPRASVGGAGAAGESAPAAAAASARGAKPRPAAAAAPDPAAAAAAAFRSRDGRIEFRVPQPSDAEWDDYQQMLRHPAYRSSGTGSPGFALPYDPEWRSLERGRRDAPAVDVVLETPFANAEALAQVVLDALRDGNLDRLLQLHVTRSEFVGICWPEFPQSRPYLKIPEAEAWSFQQTKCSEAAMSALRTWGGRPLVLDRLEIARTTRYRNFSLHEGVILRATNTATGRLEAIDVVPVIVERDGRFKVFVYGE